MKCELENQNVPEYLKEMEKTCNKVIGIKELCHGIIGYCMILLICEITIRIVCAMGGREWHYTSGHILLIAAGLAFEILFWFIGRRISEKKRQKIISFARSELVESDRRAEETEKFILKDDEEIGIGENEGEEYETKETYLKQRDFGQLWKDTYNTVCIENFPNTIESRLGIIIVAFGITLYYIGEDYFVLMQILMLFILLVGYPAVASFFLTCFAFIRQRLKGSKKVISENTEKKILTIEDKKNEIIQLQKELNQLQVVQYANEMLKLSEGKKVLCYIHPTVLDNSDWDRLCAVLRGCAGTYEYRREIVGRDKNPFIRYLIAALLSFGILSFVSDHTIETHPRNIEKEMIEFLGGDISKGTTDYPEIQTGDDAKTYTENDTDYGDKEVNGGVMPDGTVVEYIPNLYELHLGVNGFQLNDCYVSSVTNYDSHFYISGSEGILMGASANTNGELGVGDTEERLDAKGYYREVEIAEGIRHVSLGATFVAYIDGNKTLWVSGDVPGMGLTIHKTVLMEDVEYAACSAAGIIILKSDGTVWAVGRLGNNGSVEYPELTQVMEHGRYVTAGSHIFAVIQEDGSLWMWGDNSSQQCGIDAMTVRLVDEPYRVMEDVRMVWVDEMKRNSQDDRPYLQWEPDKGDGQGMRTYIQKNDHTMKVCGYGIEEDVFSNFEPREK